MPGSKCYIFYSYLSSYLTRAARTKYQRVGGPNDERLFLTGLEDVQVQGQGNTDVVRGEGPLPGLQITVLSCYALIRWSGLFLL